MRFRHVPVIVFSGFVWFGMGLFLMTKGLGFIVTTAHIPEIGASSLLKQVASLMGGFEQGALLLIAISLLIGFMKGKFVLSKSVERVVTRILSMPSPIPFTKIYAPQYYILILSMVALGISLRWLPIPLDIRGCVDVAIGSALMNGSLLYFRHALGLKQQKT